MNETRGPRLFISHSSSKRPVAEHVERALLAKGVACWVAPRDVEPGASFARAIPEAIRQTDGVLLLFCSDSVKSRHVERELILADQLGKAIIPLRLEKIDPGELSYHLASSQWLDWLEQRDAVIDRIAARAHDFHNQGPASSSPPAIGGAAAGVESGQQPANAQASAPQPNSYAPDPAANGGGAPAGPAPTGGSSKAVWIVLGGIAALGLIGLIVWLALRGSASPTADNRAAPALINTSEDAGEADNETADDTGEETATEPEEATDAGNEEASAEESSDEEASNEAVPEETEAGETTGESSPDE